MALLAALPLIVAAIGVPFEQDPRGLSYLWIAWYSVTIAAIFYCGFYRWQAFVSISDSIDELVPSASKRVLRDWLTSAWDIRLQVGTAALAGGLSIAAMFAIRDALHGELSFSPASWVAVVLTGTLSAWAGLWNIVGALLPRRLRAVSSMNIIWFDPIETPGIRQLSRYLGRNAMWGGIGLGLFSVPIAWGEATGAHTIAFVSASAFALIATGMTMMFIGYFPQYWLTSIVFRYRSEAIEEIRATIASSPIEALQSVSDFHDALGSVQRIQGTRSATFNFSRVTQGIAVWLFSIVGYLVPLISHFV